MSMTSARCEWSSTAPISTGSCRQERASLWPPPPWWTSPLRKPRGREVNNSSTNPWNTKTVVIMRRPQLGLPHDRWHVLPPDLPPDRPPDRRHLALPHARLLSLSTTQNPPSQVFNRLRTLDLLGHLLHSLRDRPLLALLYQEPLQQVQLRPSLNLVSRLHPVPPLGLPLNKASSLQPHLLQYTNLPLVPVLLLNNRPEPLTVALPVEFSTNWKRTLPSRPTLRLHFTT